MAYYFPEPITVSSFSAFLWVYGQTLIFDNYILLSRTDFTSTYHISFGSNDNLFPYILIKKMDETLSLDGSKKFQATDQWAYVGVSFDAEAGKLQFFGPFWL